MELTTTGLLSQMNIGSDYTATHLARLLSVPTDVVRDMLLALVKERRVEMVLTTRRGWSRFRLVPNACGDDKALASKG